VTPPANRASRRPPVELVGLFLIFAASAGLSLWQASNHLTPTIFTDELEMTTLSRSIADTGHGMLQGAEVAWRSVPLGAYLSAPFWWIDDVPTAYEGIKTLGALMMASAVFPAYGLARLAVRPGWALFAAAGTGLAPALAYAPILVKEPAAYPVATLALFLIARWAAAPGWRKLALALAACEIGYLAKDQLAVLFATLLLTALALMWTSGTMRTFRATWSRGDWVGAATLAAGVVIIANAFITHRSTSWYVSTTVFKDRMLDYSLWAAGALTIGVGIVPTIAGLASLVRPRAEERQPGVRALAVVTFAAVCVFGFYTAVKAAYLSTVFATLTLERNLIYLVPLLFAGTALFFQRRGGRTWAVVAAACFALYLVRGTPYGLTTYPNYEAHGLAVAAFANRIFRWPTSTITHAFTMVTIVATILLLLVSRIRVRAAIVLVTVLAATTLAWTATAEVYAAHGESLLAERLYGTLPKPVNWLDRQTRMSPVIFLGHAVSDQNPVHLLEFWNRAVTGVWSLDGTALSPGVTLTPNLVRSDGTLTAPHTDYVLTVPGVDIVGRRLGPPVAGYQLVRLPGQQLRLRTAQTGIAPDGWMGELATYARYSVRRGERGTVRVRLSRESWCGKDKRAVVTVRLGTVAVSESQEASIGRLLQERTGVIHSCQVLEYSLPTPDQPWLVEVTIEPTFSPKELDPSLTDPRQLGAVVTFGYEPAR
jgi:hypothetical protein